MSEFHITILAMTVYKVLTLLVGLASLYFGYRLFLAGVHKSGGDIETNLGEQRSLTLKRGAPGTFFALFGTIIISIGLFKGLGVERATYIPQELNQAAIPSSVTQEPAQLKDFQAQSVIGAKRHDKLAQKTLSSVQEGNLLSEPSLPPNQVINLVNPPTLDFIQPPTFSGQAVPSEPFLQFFDQLPAPPPPDFNLKIGRADFFRITGDAKEPRSSRQFPIQKPRKD
jgi:hypothetical protein